MGYEFSVDWFEGARVIWSQILPQLNPKKLLEVGSFEGRSACFLIENLAKDSDIELHCVDTWGGGIEHQGDGFAVVNMSEVEPRFLKNIGIAIDSVSGNVDLHVHKKLSDIALVELIADGKSNYFDFIYIDGSHQAPDVLSDALLAFKLLRVGGLLAFDDYLWNEPLSYGVDPIRSPKIAIDSFTNVFCRKLKIIPAHLGQIYIQKTSV